MRTRTATHRRIVVPVAIALLMAACSDNGPTYPTVFDPVQIQTELSTANAALGHPTTTSFAALGLDIDEALVAVGGGAALTGMPALMLEEQDQLAPSARLTERLKALATQRADLSTASVIPAGALGKSFEYDTDLDRYVISVRVGAPANGVRFVLYAVDQVSGLIVEPLIETGYTDLTRTATSNTATARVQVYTGGLTSTKVLDYSATVSGAATSPEVHVIGFARNATDSLTFNLAVSYSIANESITIDWRTAVPTQGLISRARYTLGVTSSDDLRITIDAMLGSESGRVDMDGTFIADNGGTIVVRVNGQVYARITVPGALSADPPTILDANGDPLSAEEEELLQQIFEWFEGASTAALSLLDPVSTLLDAAF